MSNSELSNKYISNPSEEILECVQHVSVIYDRSACVGGWVANLSYISVELLYYLNGHTKEVSWAALQMPTVGLQLTFFHSLTTRSSTSTDLSENL